MSLARSYMKRSGFHFGVTARTFSTSRAVKDTRGRRLLNRVGKKAKLRETINRPNRARFAAMGLLNVCEARLPGCWPNGRLTWAHGKKDRFLTMSERKYLVIRCCTVCHHRLDEQMSHEEMLSFVQDVIERREFIDAA